MNAYTQEIVARKEINGLSRTAICRTHENGCIRYGFIQEYRGKKTEIIMTMYSRRQVIKMIHRSREIGNTLACGG